MIEVVREHLEEAQAGLSRLLEDQAAQENIAAVAMVMALCLQKGGKILSCGNGGSMCDAMHFAEELSGRYRNDRPAYAAMSISDVSHITCVANDFGYKQVFARFIEANGKSGDIFVGFSTSGTSENVLEGARRAKSLGMTVVGMTGKPGSALEVLADHCICTPAGRYADRVQELHIKVVHILIDLIERLMEQDS